jgi:formylglycine-generating enzyme required for sulfatase activity
VLTVEPIAMQMYTGNPIQPAVTVKYGSAILKLTTDYTVSYSNNTNVGTAIVTITGVNNYAGYSATATFIINSINAIPTVADFDISGIGTFIYDGSSKIVTITPKSGKSTGVITIKYGSSNTTAPSSVGIYNITFDVAATTGFNAVNGLSAGTLTIIKKIEMVSIPAGTFTMGSPISEAYQYDETQHSVTLSSFFMSKYQVTQEQYQAVMGSNPSLFSSNPQVGKTQGKRPVDSVSWYDALVFCNKLSVMEGLSPAYRIMGSTISALWGTVPTSSNATWNAVEIVADSTGYRLPTEAQWEYACRADTTTVYNTGTTISNNTGWYRDNSGSKTHEVGKKPANAWGLYDMHGNVWEWCWDWYGDYSSSAQTNPMGASSGICRVLRGESWDNVAGGLRSACRCYGGDPSGGNLLYSESGILGFRLVRP